MRKEHGWMKCWLVLGVVSVVGCSKPNPASCLDGHCSDPELPFCDVDGTIAGEPNKCVEVSCTAGEFASCRGDRSLVCNATGDNFDLVDCPNGCGSSGCLPCTSPECEKRIVPRYVAAECEQLATADFIVSSSAVLDTSSPLNCHRIVQQQTGPELCVLHYGTIKVQSNQLLSVAGSRALVLVADRAFDIDGVIDVGGKGSTNGPGGGFTKSGTGNGGAGYRHAGAAGATTVNGGAANGGAAGTHPGSLLELFGGRQPATVAGGNVGGGGGGGVTLISCRGSLSVNGVVDAGGGGGIGQQCDLGNCTPASGGGSGGTIVLQGLDVRVTGQIFANGGGGGSGGSIGSPGSNGTRSTSGAPGGTDVFGTGGGSGGFGGTAMMPSIGLAPDGAGGGSAGFILTFTPMGVMPTLNPLSVSPPFETNGAVATN